ncbi:hypothetical protein GZH46_00317 [Fragariocoptes setiger]|uniref:Uncharacterized protein n=1 Tax=Fragariocoptes setiger TaxID=1670756 RepID=A0ABQ7SCH0_9ACAR|nr:hypothetical protein GZH46_00317 [Fragariocoptes setiger]
MTSSSESAPANYVAGTSEEMDDCEDNDQLVEEKYTKIAQIFDEKGEEIKHTVDLINEADQVGVSTSENSFVALTRLVSDDKVKHMVNRIAGQDTNQVLEEALTQIKERQSLEAKQTAFRQGLQKLSSNLATKSSMQADPAFNMLLGLIKRPHHYRTTTISRNYIGKLNAQLIIGWQGTIPHVASLVEPYLLRDSDSIDPKINLVPLKYKINVHGLMFHKCIQNLLNVACLVAACKFETDCQCLTFGLMTMASNKAIALMLLVAAVQTASANLGFGGYGPYPGAYGYGAGFGAYGPAAAAVPAAAAHVESARANNHAVAAESKATEAAVDRALGMPVAAAINERQALGHTAASTNAAVNANADAAIAGGAGGSGLAATGASLSASRAIGSTAAVSPAGAPVAAAMGAASAGAPLGAASMIGAAAANGAAAIGGAPGAAYGAYGPAGLYGPLAGGLGVAPHYAYGGPGASPYALGLYPGAASTLAAAAPAAAAAAGAAPAAVMALGAAAGQATAAHRIATNAAFGAGGPYYGVGSPHQHVAAALTAPAATGAGAAAAAGQAAAAQQAALAGQALAGTGVVAGSLEAGSALGTVASLGSLGSPITLAHPQLAWSLRQTGYNPLTIGNRHLQSMAPSQAIVQGNALDRIDLIGPVRELAQGSLESGAGLAPGAARRALDAQTAAPLEAFGAHAGARTLLGVAGGVAGVDSVPVLEATLMTGGTPALAHLATLNNVNDARVAGAQSAEQAVRQAAHAQRAGLAYRDARLAGARDSVNVEGAITNAGAISDSAWATHDTAQRAESALTGADVATDTLGTTLDADGAFLPPVTASLVRAAPYGPRLTVRDIMPRPYAVSHYWPTYAQAIRYAQMAMGGAAGAGVNAIYANHASHSVPALGPELPISGALNLGTLHLPPRALMPLGATLALEPRDAYFKDYVDAVNYPYRSMGLREFMLNDPALRLQREVSRTRVYW